MPSHGLSDPVQRRPDRRATSGPFGLDRRRLLVAFVGIALFTLGGALGSRVATALGVLFVLSTVMVWSYLGPALDRVADAYRAAKLQVGVWRLRLGGDDDQVDATERLRERYADGELTEAEFEQRMETVLQTDDEEVAELIVED